MELATLLYAVMAVNLLPFILLLVFFHLKDKGVKFEHRHALMGIIIAMVWPGALVVVIVTLISEYVRAKAVACEQQLRNG